MTFYAFYLSSPLLHFKTTLYYVLLYAMTMRSEQERTSQLVGMLHYDYLGIIFYAIFLIRGLAPSARRKFRSLMQILHFCANAVLAAFRRRMFSSLTQSLYSCADAF